MIFSPRIARGFYLLSAYQKATTIFVVAKFNFTANFARRRLSFFYERRFTEINFPYS